MSEAKSGDYVKNVEDEDVLRDKDRRMPLTTFRIVDREAERYLRVLATRRGRGVTEALNSVLRREVARERRAFLGRKTVITAAMINSSQS
jgi:hypothetical protein